MNQTMNPYLNQLMPRQTNGINWVQGVEGAKAFVLQPRENVVLMDSESDDTFFIKICDDIGRCTLRRFKYQEEVAEPTTDMSEYVKKSELESLVNKMLGGRQDEQDVSRVKSK